MYVKVGRYGRIVLPKEIRERYGLGERSRLVIRERHGEIVLIPVKRYERPTEALYGSLGPDFALDDPKRVARERNWKRLSEEIR